MDFQGGQYGQCILTSLPIVSTKRVTLPDGPEPRASAVATLKTGEGLITVANIHFYRTETERLNQARQLFKELSQIKHPVFLVGDFNSRPGDRIMNFLGKTYFIPEKQGPQKFTFSAENPLIEIDYVLFRPANAYNVVEYRVIEDKIISDHYPLICVLEKAED
jgi:endonuclease/exonuclease/phosphatase family metal-dependent hydrolase